MKIIVKKAGQIPEVREVENELHVFQEIVGGYIECFPIFDNVLCVCDEEGKLKGLPINFAFAGDIIVGDVFFCAENEGDFESLDAYQINILMRAFTSIENDKRM